MKRIQEKVKDLVEVRKLFSLRDYVGNPSETLAAYHFTDATAELMIKFHRFRKAEHRSTTEALMRAQKELLSQGTHRHPFYWAGFTTIGGYSDF